MSMTYKFAHTWSRAPQCIPREVCSAAYQLLTHDMAQVFAITQYMLTIEKLRKCCFLFQCYKIGAVVAVATPSNIT